MNAEQQKQNEVVLCHLERERELWLPHYQVSIRAEGFNSDANTRADFFMRRINALLEELVIVDGTQGS